LAVTAVKGKLIWPFNPAPRKYVSHGDKSWTLASYRRKTGGLLSFYPTSSFVIEENGLLCNVKQNTERAYLLHFLTYRSDLILWFGITSELKLRLQMPSYSALFSATTARISTRTSTYTRVASGSLRLNVCFLFRFLSDLSS
jgi:hypothetical protein